MTIDRMVQEKADAYRNNPAALQKNYQMNQDLLDLLALQKIKSEKDAAARELQMSMEQNPQTIAEQRGVEAVDRTKDDLVKQVGGVAAQRQRQQQQNIQRAAAGAPPAGAQMTGVAGQSAPNMRMQSGGIVSFANGDKVEAKPMTPAELLAGVNYEGGVEAFKKEDPATQQRILSTINSQRSSRRPGITDLGVSYLIDAIQSPLVGSVNLASDFLRGVGVMGPGQKGFMEQPLTAISDRTREKMNDPRVQPVDMSRLQPPPAAAVATSANPSAGVGGATDNVPPAAPPLVFPSPTMDSPVTANRTNTGTSTTASLDPTYTTGIKNLIDTQTTAASGLQGRVDASPDVYAGTAVEDAEKNLDRSGIASKYGDMQRRQRTLSERGAASRKDNRFYDLLSRAGGQGALANIGRAASDMRRGDRMQDQLDLANEQAIEQKGLAADIDIGKKAVDTGVEALRIKTSDRNNAVQAQTKLYGDIGQSLSDQARRGLDVTTANMTKEQTDARIATQLAVAELGANSRVAVAEYNGKIQVRGQDIQKLASEAKDRQTLTSLMIQVDRELAKVDAGIAKSVTDSIMADVQSLNLKGAERENYIKEKTAIARAANAATRESLLDTQKFIRGRVQGAFTLPGAPPDAMSGFSNLTSTPASP